MSYYMRDTLPEGPVLGKRRPTINEFFLSAYTLGIYRGCEFGCPYCDGWVYDQRGFSESVQVPLDMPRRLAEELRTVDRGDLIGITALSDAYQPAEQSYRITRQVLQVLAEAGQPCLILTKSLNVLDDIALLRRIHEQSLAIVMTTLVSVDHIVAEKIEGKAPVPALRLDMLARLKREGIPVGVAMVPVIPYLNDTDYAVRKLLGACAKAEVDFVIWDYLYILNRFHQHRVAEMLSHVNSYPNRYYRDIYGQQQVPDPKYRLARNLEILQRCDHLGLAPHVPHSIYAGRLSPHNEAAALLKHMAFRNMLQGQNHMAHFHRELADQIYRGEIAPQKIAASPNGKQIQAVLAQRGVAL